MATERQHRQGFVRPDGNDKLLDALVVAAAEANARALWAADADDAAAMQLRTSVARHPDTGEVTVTVIEDLPDGG